MQITQRISLLIFLFISYYLEAQQLVTSYKPVVAGTAYQLVTKDAEGNILVYGHFDNLNGQYLGRLLKLDANGKQVAGFKSMFADGAIGHLRVQKDGKILISGGFNIVNGSASKNMIRLNSDGSVDASFNCPINVGSFEFQSDGRAIVIGPSALYRLNTDGSIDNTFAFQNYLSGVSLLAVGPNDEIYFTSYSTVHKTTPDGADDNSFHTGTGVNQDAISALTVQSDGKIVVGGFFTQYNGTTANSLLRLNVDGQIDNSFLIGTGPQGQIFKIVERANKNLLIGGQFYNYNNQPASLVELKTDGSLQKIVSIVSTNSITSILEFPDHSIAIGGEFSVVNNYERDGIAKFNNDYTLSSTFNPRVSFNNSNGRFLEVRDNGSVITGGSDDFQGIYHQSKIKEAKAIAINPLGVYDDSFKPKFSIGHPSIFSALIQDDNKVIFSGWVQAFGGPTLLRVNADGTPDNTFAIGSAMTTNSNTAFSYCLEKKNATIYVGANMDAFNGAPTNGLVALNLNGTVKKTFLALPPQSNVYRIGFQSDGKIIVAGTFSFAGVSKQLLRLNEDGSIDNTFNNIDISGAVYDVAVDSVNRIYLIGSFSTFNGALINDMIRLFPNGNLDTSFDCGTGFTGSFADLRSIALLPGGRVAIGGYFDFYQGHQSSGFVVVDSTAAWVSTPSVAFGKGSVAINLEYSNNALYVAGRFLSPDYTEAYGMAKILLAPVTIASKPDNLEVKLKSPGNFSITWSDKSSNELAFVLERAVLNTTQFIAIDTLASNSSSTVDSGIESRKKYFYRIRAVNDAGLSAYSNIDSLEWLPEVNGQINLSVTQSRIKEFDLSWQGTVTNHLGFIVERSAKTQDNYVSLDTVLAQTFSYIDVVADAGVYFYKVSAYNEAGKLSSNQVAAIITEIADQNDGGVAVYPVPMKEILYAQISDQAKPGSWTLLTIDGKTIPMSAQFSNDIFSFDVSNLHQGVYIIQHTRNGKIWRKRIVKN